MIQVLVFLDMEFPQGKVTQGEKSWKFQWMGGGEVLWNPLEWKILGCRVKLGKKTSVGGIDISWNHSLSVLNVLLHKV